MTKSGWTQWDIVTELPLFWELEYKTTTEIHSSNIQHASAGEPIRFLCSWWTIPKINQPSLMIIDAQNNKDHVYVYI